MKLLEIVNMMVTKEHQHVWSITFLIKNNTGSDSNKQSESKCKSAEELHEPVIKKLKRRKVYARFKKNIWERDLAEIELLSSKNKIVNCLLFAIDVCSK